MVTSQPTDFIVASYLTVYVEKIQMAQHHIIYNFTIKSMGLKVKLITISVIVYKSI